MWPDYAGRMLQKLLNGIPRGNFGHGAADGPAPEAGVILAVFGGFYARPHVLEVVFERSLKVPLKTLFTNGLNPSWRAAVGVRRALPRLHPLQAKVRH